MRLSPALILLCLPAEAADPSPRPDSRGVKAVWVTRFDYRAEEDVRAVLANCASLGFNTVLFQVRGQADAYYGSRLEPWAERLGGADPGFDPLEVACREARRLGLGLHAWVNVMTVWKGRTPPADRRHVYHRHPEWIVTGPDGRRQRLNDHYLCLNPCLPAVRDHLTAVARDIAARYPVDGLHLDYVRFIEGDWSYDRETLSLFGGSPSRRPGAWDEFRREAVTEVVRSIRRAVREARPKAVLSAAVFPTAKARRTRFQDAEEWVREGLVDWVFPMTYEDGTAEFEVLVEEAYRAFGSEACLPGVGAYRHETAEQTVRQVRVCRGGFAVFAYSSFFSSADDSQKEQDRLRRGRREAMRKTLN
jgi:uncharacterized lipoprotein YddW (UPF0748 family)